MKVIRLVNSSIKEQSKERVYFDKQNDQLQIDLDFEDGDTCKSIFIGVIAFRYLPVYMINRKHFIEQGKYIPSIYSVTSLMNSQKTAHDFSLLKEINKVEIDLSNSLTKANTYLIVTDDGAWEIVAASIEILHV